MKQSLRRVTFALCAALPVTVSAQGNSPVSAQGGNSNDCRGLPNHSQLKAALDAAVCLRKPAA